MSNDPRIDRIVTWALNGFVGIALAVGAWFFSGLAGDVRQLRTEMAELRTEVRVMGAKEHPVKVDDIRGLQRKIDSHTQLFFTLAERLAKLEARRN